MIVLDTNVISELMRDAPNPAVLAWVDEQTTASLFVTAVTEAEIRLGIALLPAGKRRDGMAEAVDRAFASLLRGRVLPFDSEAARAFAMIAADRRASGRPISQFDCQIAAIASSRGSLIATRNVRDFEGCGVEIVDPWERAQ
jgi:predicted nucleic acid-binding protein